MFRKSKIFIYEKQESVFNFNFNYNYNSISIFVV